MIDIRVVELFAGIGGFRYGLERMQLEDKNVYQSTSTIRNKIGSVKQFDNRSFKRLFNCVWANEIDKYACQIYRKNFGGKELYEGDITKVKAETIPDHDILCAGFPCQSFSIAGTRGGFDDTRGTLFFDIVRICRTKKPRYILLENVKGLLSHGSGTTFQTILKILTDLGYILQWQVLNSKNFGVPQNRERVFIIGHLRGESRPEIFPIGEKHQNSFEGNQERNGRKISNAITGGYSRQNAKGTYIKQLNQPKHSNDRVYSAKGISPTLNTMQGGRRQPFIQNPNVNSIRRLTPTECERLQGFPDGWTEGISDTQRYKCLGNAVTTNVITEIGRKLCQINSIK